MDRLKKDSVIVWLTAAPGEILKRTLKDGDTRPLLKGKSKSADIQSLLRSRKPFYEQSAISL
jgi:shikimate kinase